MNTVIQELSPDSLTPLWRKPQLEVRLAQSALPAWVQASYTAFVETLSNDQFPCFFGTIAEQKEMLRFVIAPPLTEPMAMPHLLTAIYQYLEEEAIVAHTSQHDDVFFLTLVILFPPAPSILTLDHYAQQAFDVLNALHQLDPAPWPTDIATASPDRRWRYCLGGRSLFVNVSTPANQQRRSRHLGPGMVFVINPEDLFEKAWDRWGEQPRREIYHRVEQYDAIPPYPLVYPWDNEGDRHHIHAKVMVLPEDNQGGYFFQFQFHSHHDEYAATPSQGTCPFHAVPNPAESGE